MKDPHTEESGCIPGASQPTVAATPQAGDLFGDRMKSYEHEEDRRFPPGLPVYARIDGRSFSRFTKGMERPFDPRMCEAMTATVAGLVERTHARIGYTQSDEISLVWLGDDERSQVFFDGRVQKLASVLASLAGVLFYASLEAAGLGDCRDRLPHFDCRVLALPSRTEAANMFLWREMDATKNAVQMAAQHHCTHRELQGLGRADQLAKLSAAGVNFEDYPARFKRGVFVRRDTVQRLLTADELARIPEKHRPPADQPVERSHVRTLDMPPFVTVANREAVIFDGAEPETAP